eukprot:3414675-Amphidinium_carterae.1
MMFATQQTRTAVEKSPESAALKVHENGIGQGWLCDVAVTTQPYGVMVPAYSRPDQNCLEHHISA